MSESITHNMVGGEPSLDAKIAAAKVMAEKIGNLLDIRGFDVTSRKPYADETKCNYGVEFGFAPAGPLTEGTGIKLTYFSNERPDRLSLKFNCPTYENHDGVTIPWPLAAAKSDVTQALDEAKGEEQKRVCQNLLDRWDDSMNNRYRKCYGSDVNHTGYKAWRRCTLIGGALDKIELIVKQLEKAWPFYLAKYQFAMVSAVARDNEAKAFAKYRDSIRKILGGNQPSDHRNYADSVMYTWDVGNISDAMLQVDTASDGSVVLNSVKIDKDKAEGFLKHLMQWKG